LSLLLQELQHIMVAVVVVLAGRVTHVVTAAWVEADSVAAEVWASKDQLEQQTLEVAVAVAAITASQVLTDLQAVAE
jgi:hypothetical protein